jgi:secondary thiamine-phosphate synthase enzyme
MIDITPLVQEAVGRFGVEDGLCQVFCPHTTAGIVVNEGADPEVQADLLNALGRLAPAEGSYAHREGNADAHIQAVLAGPGVLLPVDEGRLALGTWQKVFFCEFDGPRRREVWLQLLKQE